MHHDTDRRPSYLFVVLYVQLICNLLLDYNKMGYAVMT